MAELTVTRLRCESLSNPLGIGTRCPRLSWEIVAPDRGVRQSAYEVRVAEHREELEDSGPTAWGSGRVDSESQYLDCGGRPLRSGERRYWQVRVWDRGHRRSNWSEPAWWEMGLLAAADWTASWITPDPPDQELQERGRLPILRRRFTLEQPVARARLYVTCLGLYEVLLNGRTVGDHVLAPGWTSYRHRLQYQTYDVAGHLQQGENACGLFLGNGWYRGYLGVSGRRQVWGERLGLLLQLEVEHADGSQTRLVTDSDWLYAPGPIERSDLYMGESYDARGEIDGFAEPGFDDRDWAPVFGLDPPAATLVAPVSPPVRRIEELRPRRILHTPAGETVFDFGQNLVGRVRLRARGGRGTTVRLRHAEVLDAHGNLYTENLRRAAQEVRYRLRGGAEEEVYEPRFTYHGFRYVAIEGYPGEPDLDSLTGVVLHSDLPRRCRFETSSPLINRLNENIVWSQRGNFVDIPTDCPQRDERLGWTGDAQLFAPTAAFNLEVSGFFNKWLRDLALDQHADGAVPHVVPDVFSLTRELRIDPAGSSGWGDAAVLVPFTLYLHHGDRRLLERQYPSMTAWVDYMAEQAGADCIWQRGFHFGDWLAPDRWGRGVPTSTTSSHLIATACFAHSTRLLAQVAELLGRADDAEHYTALRRRIEEAYRRHFLPRPGRMDVDTQTAHVLAIAFDLVQGEGRATALERLVEDIRRRDYHLSTGFLGSRWLCPVLSENGYGEVAYELLNQTTCPSWLYPLSCGATTIWERWDGIDPDDASFQDPGMNSFNHFALGSIGEWLYTTVAGVSPDPRAPGFKHVRIAPLPGGGLTRVRFTLCSPYGEIGSAWELENGRFALTVEVPANTSASVRLPWAEAAKVRESGRRLERGSVGIEAVDTGSEAVEVRVGSGRYRFDYPSTRFPAWAGGRPRRSDG